VRQVATPLFSIFSKRGKAFHVGGCKEEKGGGGGRKKKKKGRGRKYEKSFSNPLLHHRFRILTKKRATRTAIRELKITCRKKRKKKEEEEKGVKAV